MEAEVLPLLSKNQPLYLTMKQYMNHNTNKSYKSKKNSSAGKKTVLPRGFIEDIKGEVMLRQSFQGRNRQKASVGVGHSLGGDITGGQNIVSVNSSI